jgi:hypothetical protein
MQFAQKATASMGQFDKKLKNEPAAAKSQKLLKKKSSSKLDSLNYNRTSEKERNMKIFATMEKKKDLAASGNKATANLSDTKVMKKIKKKDSARRTKS